MALSIKYKSFWRNYGTKTSARAYCWISRSKPGVVRPAVPCGFDGCGRQSTKMVVFSGFWDPATVKSWISHIICWQGEQVGHQKVLISSLLVVYSPFEWPPPMVSLKVSIEIFIEYFSATEMMKFVEILKTFQWNPRSFSKIFLKYLENFQALSKYSRNNFVISWNEIVPGEFRWKL